MTSTADAQPIVHVCCPASPAGEDMACLGIADWAGLVAAIEPLIGPSWRITGSPPLIWAPFQPEQGGRMDDADRAADLQQALADDAVHAIVALRGGAWLLRILERIDFSVLDRRRRPVLLVGFSEWTCLSLVASRHRAALAVHHTAPLYMGRNDPAVPLTSERRKDRWCQVWSSIRALLETRTPAQVLRGRMVGGPALPAGTVRLCGGNLTLLCSLAGTRFHDSAHAAGGWLVLEDINESIGRIDRKIAQLHLSGLLEGVEGVLLGGFHNEGRDLSRSVAALLAAYLPPGLPVVAECNFGHFWPAAPFPLRRPVRLVAGEGGTVDVAVDWPQLLA